MLLFRAGAACPLFTEFFPDPTLVSDVEGEFVEIRLDDFRSDSLTVQFEEKPSLRFRFPKGRRLVLVHDSLHCPQREGVSCGLLGTLSLPNSRESVWRLRAGTCSDSITLPAPKAGKSLQRVAASDEWVVEDPTMGEAHPRYELDVEDCALAGVTASFDAERWVLHGWLEGCDSSRLRVESVNVMGRDEPYSGQITVRGRFRLEIPQRGTVAVRLELPDDEAPLNNVVDTLLMAPGIPPVVFSEVHHCPQEPEPEWVEVYNPTVQAFSLSRLRFCARGGAWGTVDDSILPFEALLLTKDSASLREYLGFKDVRIAQVSLGILNNTGGSLSICYDGAPVDSTAWDKSLSVCPSGFSPLSGRRDNTPGFLTPHASERFSEPVVYRLSSRVVRHSGNPLRVRVESEWDVQLKLLDSSRMCVWKRTVHSGDHSWTMVPLQSQSRYGVYFVSILVGRFEKVVGIVYRP